MKEVAGSTPDAADIEKPRCIRCVHYYITHDEVFPYGCRTLNFKSAREPSRDVMEASGEPCHYFLAKKA